MQMVDFTRHGRPLDALLFICLLACLSACDKKDPLDGLTAQVDASCVSTPTTTPAGQTSAETPLACVKRQMREHPAN